MIKKKYFFAITFSIVLTFFTTYVLLDTFVITKKKVVVSDEDYYNSLYKQDENMQSNKIMEGDDFFKPDNDLGDSPRRPLNKMERKNKNELLDVDDGPEIDNSHALDVNTYDDDNISVTVTKYREYDTDIYVADVKLSSMKYFKTAFADDTYGRNITQTTSTMAKEKNAVLAVNGDFYGARNNGYVIRNGVLYRDAASKNQEDLLIKTDGTFEIINEDEISATSIMESDVAQVFSFGPAIVKDGEISVTDEDEVGKAMASNPRTSLGIIDNLHYIFVVSDGRTEKSQGLSLYQLAEFMEKLNVKTAYNLDGGGSSAMYFNGSIVNNPTTNGKSIKERKVSDIVYIGY